MKAECKADYSEDGFHCECDEGYHGNGKIQPVDAVAGLYGAGGYKKPKGEELIFELLTVV